MTTALVSMKENKIILFLYCIIVCWSCQSESVYGVYVTEASSNLQLVLSENMEYVYSCNGDTINKGGFTIVQDGPSVIFYNWKNHPKQRICTGDQCGPIYIYNGYAGKLILSEDVESMNFIKKKGIPSQQPID